MLETFDGQRFDEATGLYYFGARHYHPVIRWFLTADTHLEDPLDLRTLNPYAFGAGAPIRRPATPSSTSSPASSHGVTGWSLEDVWLGVGDANGPSTAQEARLFDLMPAAP